MTADPTPPHRVSSRFYCDDLTHTPLDCGLVHAPDPGILHDNTIIDFLTFLKRDADTLTIHRVYGTAQDYTDEAIAAYGAEGDNLLEWLEVYSKYRADLAPKDLPASPE